MVVFRDTTHLTTKHSKLTKNEYCEPQNPHRVLLHICEFELASTPKLEWHDWSKKFKWRVYFIISVHIDIVWSWRAEVLNETIWIYQANIRLETYRKWSPNSSPTPCMRCLCNTKHECISLRGFGSNCDFLFLYHCTCVKYALTIIY